MLKPSPASLIAGYFLSVLISATGSAPEPLPATSSLANFIQLPPKPSITPVTILADRNQQSLPNEGVYKAAPHSLLVDVPPAVDRRMVIPQRDTTAKIQSMEPPMQLIPWRR